MSKAIILILVALAILALAPIVIGEKGYILIALNDYTIEGTITAFVISALLLFGVCFVLYRLVRYIWSFYGNTRSKMATRSEHKKLMALQTSIWQFINHDYAGVQQSLKKATVPDGWENIAAALAASSAIEQDNKQDARQALEKVSEADANNIAQLLVASEQAELAKDAMGQITKNKKASVQELANFADYLIAQQDWPQLAQQLARFDKKHALSDEQWNHLFEQYFAALKSDDLTPAYSNVPKRQKEVAQFHYLVNLAQYAPEKVDSDLVKLAKADKYQPVWAVLGKCQHAKLPELHKLVQSRLKKLPEDTTLLITLAYVSYVEENYELACKIFNKVLTQENASQHWRIAANCFTHTQQPEKALSLYQSYA